MDVSQRQFYSTRYKKLNGDSSRVIKSTQLNNIFLQAAENRVEPKSAVSVTGKQ